MPRIVVWPTEFKMQQLITKGVRLFGSLHNGAMTPEDLQLAEYGLVQMLHSENFGERLLHNDGIWLTLMIGCLRV